MYIGKRFVCLINDYYSNADYSVKWVVLLVEMSHLFRIDSRNLFIQIQKLYIKERQI